MADPGTIALIGMGTSAAGGITGAIGSLLSGEGNAQQAESQAAAYRYQAGVARMNADIAKQNAAYERVVGEVQAQESGMKTRAIVGKTKAIQSASGLDVNKGSAVDVRESETELGQYDQTLIRSNAARRAYGQEVEAVQHEAQAQIDIMGAASAESGASRARTAGMIGAASSILGGASSVSSRWLQYGTTFGNNAQSTRPRVGPFDS